MPERLEAAGPEIPGRVEQAAVQLFDGCVQRQNHERQERVQDAHEHREIAVHEGHGLFRNPEPYQQRADEPVGLEDQDERIGTDKRVRPERDDDQQEQPRLHLGVGPGDPVGERIAHQQARQRAHEGQPQGFPQDFQERGIEQAQVVVQRELRQYEILLAARQHRHHQKADIRQQSEQQQPQRRDADGKAVEKGPSLLHTATPLPNRQPKSRQRAPRGCS